MSGNNGGVGTSNLQNSVLAQSSSSDVCSDELFNLDWVSNSGGGLTSGSFEYEWRRSDGTVLRSWSSTQDFNGYSEPTGGIFTYYLFVRPAGCNTMVTQSNAVTVNVAQAATGTPSVISPSSNSELLQQHQLYHGPVVILVIIHQNIMKLK